VGGMKLSKFIEELQGYLKFLGDNEVTLVNRDDGEEFTVQYVDGFKDECSIVIQGEDEEEDVNE